MVWSLFPRLRQFPDISPNIPGGSSAPIRITLVFSVHVFSTILCSPNFDCYYSKFPQNITKWPRSKMCTCHWRCGTTWRWKPMEFPYLQVAAMCNRLHVWIGSLGGWGYLNACRIYRERLYIRVFHYTRYFWWVLSQDPLKNNSYTKTTKRPHKV